jgi:hypothetical protein
VPSVVHHAGHRRTRVGVAFGGCRLRSRRHHRAGSDAGAAGLIDLVRIRTPPAELRFAAMG